MSRTLMTMAAIGTAFIGTALPDRADARDRFRSVTVQGANGRGYQRHRSASRQPGSTRIQRGIQTNSGHGIETSRGRSCAGGTCTGSASHVTNNGTSWGRSGSVTGDGDGTFSYQRSRTGPEGNSRSTSGTIARPQR